MAFNIIELFSGVGTFSMALRDSGIPYRIIDSVEIDPYAVKAFNAIHGTDFKPQDVGKWDKFNDGTFDRKTRVDLITGGFPCQDISIAGKQVGIIKGKTRSGLMYEMLRIAGSVRPRMVIAENVKNILSTRHRKQFEEYIQTMFQLGYVSTWKVLDAKDFGVPQHRERVFIVSERDDIAYPRYEFPKPIPLTKKLKDVLEENVDQKYFLRDDQVKGMVKTNSKNVVGKLNIKGIDQVRRVYSKDGIAPTLSTMQGGNRQPKIIDDCYKNRDAREYGQWSPTLRAGRSDLKVSDGTKVRRLTPLSCWRLMGWSDADFHKAREAGLSDTRLYKLAGNGIVLNVAKVIMGLEIDA